MACRGRRPATMPAGWLHGRFGEIASFHLRSFQRTAELYDERYTSGQGVVTVHHFAAVRQSDLGDASAGAEIGVGEGGAGHRRGAERGEAHRGRRWLRPRSARTNWRRLRRNSRRRTVLRVWTPTSIRSRSTCGSPCFTPTNRVATSSPCVSSRSAMPPRPGHRRPRSRWA
jgi:hypothetical protein